VYVKRQIDPNFVNNFCFWITNSKTFDIWIGVE